MKFNGTKRLNVLWVAPYPYNNSNTSPWVTELARSISNHVNLTIVSFNRNIPSDCIENKGNLTIYYFKLENIIRDVIGLSRSYINAGRRIPKGFFQNFDIVHIHGTEHQFATIFKDSKTPKVISIQGFIHLTKKFVPFLSYNRFRWELQSKYEIEEIKSNSYFICRTHWDKEIINKLNPNANIFHCWEMIRSEFYQFEGGNHNSFNLIYIGGGNQFKGLYECLKTLEKVIKIDNRYRLIICGKINSKKLKHILHKGKMNQIESNIDLKGFVDSSELMTLYKSSFVLLHPTYIDNSPNSICEAQACGLPVIAFDVGGVASLINNYFSGILIKPYTLDSIIENVLKLKSEPKLYNQIRKNAKEIAKQRHSEEVILNNTLATYNSILENNDVKKNFKAY